MIVMKFGGASLGSTGKLSAVIDQIESTCAREKTVIVVSAIGSTTDWLVREDVDEATRVRELLREHEHALALAPNATAARLRRRIEELPRQMATLDTEAFQAFGEMISSDLIASILRTRGIDLREVGLSCVAIPDDGERRVDLTRTLLRMRSAGVGRPDVRAVVLGGFGGTTEDGAIRLLGRGGSDTCATAAGAAIGARVVELWKDIDGIHPTDPDGVYASQPLAALHWEAADSIARSDMRILHELSIEPAWRARVPIHVRHTGHPEEPGTWIDGGRPFSEVGERVA